MNLPKHRPLTRAEQRMWFLEQLAPKRPSANLCNGFVIRGQLDIALLSEAVAQVIDRHEALRTSFYVSTEQKPVCETAPKVQFALQIESLTGQTHEQRESTWRAMVPALAQRPFDLASAPLMRLHIAELTPQVHVALLVMHHIISDGDTSAEIFMRDAIQLMSGQTDDVAQSGDEPAEELATPADLDFWCDYLDDAPQSITLPSLGDVISDQSAVAVNLPAPKVSELQTLAKKHGVRLFDILFASFGQLLKTHSGQDTILVAWPDSGRSPDMNQVGYFGQPLPVRLDMAHGRSFMAQAESVKTTFDRILAHRGTPFASIVNAVAAGQNSRMPLFQVMFDFQHQIKPIITRDLEVRPQWWDPGVTEYEWSLFLLEQEDGSIEGRIEYHPERFDAGFMQAVSERYSLMLSAVIDNPNQVAFTPLTTRDEQQNLDWGQGASASIPNTCAHQLFEAQAALTPDAFAVQHGHERITYQALNQAANQIARQLQSLGLKPGMIVGLFLQRTTHMLTTLLAIWKAGAAILPLDPAYPSARLRLMIDDSEAGLVLSEQDLTDRITLPSHCQWVLIEDLATQRETQPSDNLNLTVNHDDLSYLIYTSGSTGVPKAIAMVHRCLVNLITWQLQDSPMREEIRALQFASLNFDISYQEILSTWAGGGTLILIDEATRRDARLLLDYLIEHEINRLFLPFIVLDQIAIAAEAQDRLPTTLREILTAGEQLRTTPALRKLFQRLPNCRLYNQYGPSEAHVITSLALDPDPQSWSDLPAIGHSIANSNILLVDSALKPVPPGAPGEILVAGACLAQGYLNRPELTKASFINYPWPQSGTTRAYRTGDLACFQADGALRFLRRIDQQYKVRGYRIDLGEIESVLSQHPGVHQAVAHVRGQGPSAQIVAYVVANQATHADLSLQSGQIQDWRNLWDITYQNSDHSDFNLAGWVSSYTEQPLPIGEMRQWRDEVVARILALKPKRALELGCGAGLLLTEIAPHCEFYGASDLSPAVVEQLKQRIAQDPSLENKVELRQAEAIDTTSWPAGSFDTIILNSVVQLFPSATYLEQVIRNALPLLAPGGRIFIGDVQNLELLAAYHAGVQAVRHGDWPIAKIRQSFNDALAREDQLIIAPDFFYRLPQQIDKITAVELNLKRGDYDNELTRFRYDVVLHTEPRSRDQANHLILPYEGPESLNIIADSLKQPGIRAASLQAIPYSRIQGDLYALDCMHDDHLQDELFRELTPSFDDRALNPGACWDLANQLDVFCHVTWSATVGCIDAWWTSDPYFVCPATPNPKPTPLTNDPLKLKRQRLLVQRLQQHLDSQLPDYMLPSHLMVLDAIPVKTNGKVDTSALPEPQGENTQQQIAPTNPTEQLLAELWQQTLGIVKVGIDDDFFALGGHSLLGVELLHHIRQHCQIDVPLAELFDKRTIRALAAQIINMQSQTSSEIEEGVL